MNSVSRCKPLLGTYVEVTVSANESRDTLIDMSIAAYGEIERIHNLMSFHDPDSELSYINDNACSQSCSISADTETVISKALELYQLTNGVFDISIAPQLISKGLLPDRHKHCDDSATCMDIHLENGKVSFNKDMLIDLGGIAKGYAVDKAMALFDDDINVVINAGGDLAMKHWQGQYVEIRHPAKPNNETITVPMQATAVATSAGYYLDGNHAIISPKTKEAVTDQNSISIFANSCMLADALTKVAFLTSADEALIHFFDAQMLLISEDGKVSSL